jgi:CheY-like chemotaxis protein
MRMAASRGLQLKHGRKRGLQMIKQGMQFTILICLACGALAHPIRSSESVVPSRPGNGAGSHIGGLCSRAVLLAHVTSSSSREQTERANIGGCWTVRILVADDEPAILAAVRVCLEAAGFEVSEASDGLAALRLCRTQSVDLVLCDVFMPNQDGLETISVLRQQNPSVKIVAMSGGGSVWTGGLLATAQELGASGVLQKPFTGKQLLAVIRQVLKSA